MGGGRSGGTATYAKYSGISNTLMVLATKHQRQNGCGGEYDHTCGRDQERKSSRRRLRIRGNKLYGVRIRDEVQRFLRLWLLHLVLPDIAYLLDIAWTHGCKFPFFIHDDDMSLFPHASGRF
jgi:hypothetical protein